LHPDVESTRCTCYKCGSLWSLVIHRRSSLHHQTMQCVRYR